MTLPATAWTHPIHERFPTVSWRVLAAEVDREITARQSTYPDRVDRGRMTQAEMDWQLQLARAWREDVGRFEQAHRPLAEGRPIIAPHRIPCQHEIAWRVRRSALMRELDQRRRHFPRWIAEGKLTQAAGDARIDALECLLALYEFGFDWIPVNGVLPAWSEPNPSAAQRATREELSAVLAEIAARTATTTPQQELFA